MLLTGTRALAKEPIMANTTEGTVWAVVEVWRGFAARARVFARRSDAQRLYLRLHDLCNLDENDVQIFETQIAKFPARRPRRRRLST
jgi:hypothetical protein